MIYLWTSGEGWTEHEITETEELVLRGITVGARARVGDGAWVGEGARVGDGATVGEGARPTIIYILGSMHAVSYWGEARIDIGCHHQSIRLWSEHFREIGEKEGYTTEQIEEYGRYIEMIRIIHEANPNTAKGTSEATV